MLHDNIHYHITHSKANDLVRSYIERIDSDLQYIMKMADFDDITINGEVFVENNLASVRHLMRVSSSDIDIEIKEYLSKSKYIHFLLKGISL